MRVMKKLLELFKDVDFNYRDDEPSFIEATIKKDLAKNQVEGFTGGLSS